MDRILHENKHQGISTLINRDITLAPFMRQNIRCRDNLAAATNPETET